MGNPAFSHRPYRVGRSRGTTSRRGRFFRSQIWNDLRAACVRVAAATVSLLTLESTREHGVPDNVSENAGSSSRTGFGSEWFWRLLATVIFISVLWILWLLWQITPRSTFNPIVFQIQQSRQSVSGQIQRAPVEGEAPAAASSPSAEAPPAGSPLSNGAPLENLRIETQIKEPPKPPAPAK